MTEDKVTSKPESTYARLTALKAALEPFAKTARNMDQEAIEKGFKPGFDEYVTDFRFSLGQMRAANSALSDIPFDIGDGEELYWAIVSAFDAYVASGKSLKDLENELSEILPLYWSDKGSMYGKEA